VTRSDGGDALVPSQHSGVRRQPLHAVHLYSSEAALIQYVVGQLAEPLLEAQPVLVFAGASHRQQIVTALTRGGLDVPRLRDAGLFAELDGHELVAALVPDGSLHVERFHEHLGNRVRALAARHGTFQLYGDAVSLLWAAGNVTAALALERCWNELAREAPFRLCCGYPTSVVGSGESTDLVEQMFREHGELALA
jgi:hypothetical protein